jgi:hypothetical protein
MKKESKNECEWKNPKKFTLKTPMINRILWLGKAVKREIRVPCPRNSPEK